MKPDGLLDLLPLWAVFPATLMLGLLAVEMGYRLGRFRLSRADRENEAPVGTMVSVTLGLVAFLLAFPFGLAGNRFDDRRQVVVEEANAIGTTYLRAGLLPEPDRTEIRKLLVEYVEVRLEAVRQRKIELFRMSEEMQGRLWARAVAVAERSPNSYPVALFLQSLNETIDVHGKRVQLGMRSRVPNEIWIALYVTAFLGLATMGYHEGLSGTRRSHAGLAVIVAFSAVMWVIVDLDRPQEGGFRVSQEALIDLRNSMTGP